MRKLIVLGIALDLTVDELRQLPYGEAHAVILSSLKAGRNASERGS